ncbi:MAG: hypothetical protein HRU38_02295 [Saccharospirillaceae bacterium]|nr:hypothetical protein [Pseudomonadales bacterium]NRB77490.1 hypothetical protein [Saccharospirillaceae bacterium]
MRCTFCEEKLLRPNMPPGSLIIIDPNEYAHKSCAEQAWVSRRMFGSVKMNSIPSNDLFELKQLLINEINLRDNLSSH